MNPASAISNLRQLTTAVVLMFLAGGLLALSFHARRRMLIQFFPSPKSDDLRVTPNDFDQRNELLFGWPVDCHWETYVLHSSEEYAEAHGTILSRDSTSSITLDLDEVRTRWPNVYSHLIKFEKDGKYTPPSDVDHAPEFGIIQWVPKQLHPKYFDKWNSNAVLINSATACAILILVAFICEYRIRRREARKA